MSPVWAISNIVGSLSHRSKFISLLVLARHVWQLSCGCLYTVTPPKHKDDITKRNNHPPFYENCKSKWILLNFQLCPLYILFPMKALKHQTEVRLAKTNWDCIKKVRMMGWQCISKLIQIPLGRCVTHYILYVSANYLVMLVHLMLINSAI